MRWACLQYSNGAHFAHRPGLHFDVELAPEPLPPAAETESAMFAAEGDYAFSMTVFKTSRHACSENAKDIGDTQERVPGASVTFSATNRVRQ